MKARIQAQEFQGIPPQISHEELDRELFQMFDHDGSGFIDVGDFDFIGRAMGWKQDTGKGSFCLTVKCVT